MAKGINVTIEGNVLFPNCCPVCMASDPDAHILLEHKTVSAKNTVTLFSGRVTYNVTTLCVPFCEACAQRRKQMMWLGNIALYGGLIGTFLSPVFALVGVPIGMASLIRARKYHVIEATYVDNQKNAITFSIKNTAYAEAMRQINTLVKSKEPEEKLELLHAG
jgi:hypothetical protein